METSTANPMVYKLSNAAVNEASIDFEVDGIATINWSGFAKTITDMQSGGDVKDLLLLLVGPLLQQIAMRSCLMQLQIQEIYRSCSRRVIFK